MTTLSRSDTIYKLSEAFVKKRTPYVYTCLLRINDPKHFAVIVGPKLDNESLRFGFHYQTYPNISGMAPHGTELKTFTLSMIHFFSYPSKIYNYTIVILKVTICSSWSRNHFPVCTELMLFRPQWIHYTEQRRYWFLSGNSYVTHS